MRKEPLIIHIAWPLKDDAMELIAKSDPRVRVAKATYVEPESRRDLRRKGHLDELAKESFPISKEYLDLARTAEVMYGFDYPTDLPKLAPKLKWVQLIGAGADHLKRYSGLFQSNVTVTALGGFSSRNVAEYAMSAILGHVKASKGYVLAQPKKQWNRLSTDTVYGKTVGIIGLGRIGGFVAQFSKAFDMRVLACRRSAEKQPPGNVDAVYAPERLLEMLPLCDFVIVATALTPETHGLIGEPQLRAMKKTALIVNIARGEVVREQALIKALSEGWIAAAHLDVFEHEPLPPEDPLWDMPNVIVTPHSSVMMHAFAEKGVRFFIEQIQRYLAGEPLLYVVDKQKGY